MILDPMKVLESFWATALEDAQLQEYDNACEDGRDHVDIYGEIATEYKQQYIDAITRVCTLADALLADQNLNTFPARCPNGDLNDIFGSDLYLTAVGHGAGFWDGDWEPIGDELTEVAKYAPHGDLCEHVKGGYFLE